MTEGCFEARKWAWRQTKEGIVVSFLIHPNDINAALAIAPLGTIYAIGFREMPEGDQSAGPELTDSRPSFPAPEAEAQGQDKPGKLKRRFSEMSRSQQAGMLCEDTRFIRWIGATGPDHAAEMVRARCKIKSRAQLDDYHGFPDAAGKWDCLATAFHAENSLMAEQRA